MRKKFYVRVGWLINNNIAETCQISYQTSKRKQKLRNSNEMASKFKIPEALKIEMAMVEMLKRGTGWRQIKS